VEAGETLTMVEEEAKTVLVIEKNTLKRFFQ
jgi:hypothetical protein